MVRLLVELIQHLECWILYAGLVELLSEKISNLLERRLKLLGLGWIPPSRSSGGLVSDNGNMSPLQLNSLLYKISLAPNLIEE